MATTLSPLDNEPVGTVMFLLADPLFWPDVSEDGAYIHRLAVRRRFAGGVLSSVLLNWAVERTAMLKRNFLRLDCDAARPSLRAVYERFGFRYHSDRQVGPYLVARYEFPILAH
jgi:GNAT superfamily N-acetyltransferase